MPSSAALPVPTMMAVGVARPSAHGQAMMMTAMVVPMASVQRPSSGPNSAQPANVSAASAEHDRDEPRRDLVGEALHRRLRALGVLDEAHDLRQRRVLADGAGPDTRLPVRLSGGADDDVAGGLLDRHALPGQHALVDAGRAVLDDAVDGDLLAGPDPDQVADDDVLDGDVDLGAVAQHPGGLRGEADEGLDGGGGLLLRLPSIQRPIVTSARMTSDVSKYTCSGSPHACACAGHRVANAL